MEHKSDLSCIIESLYNCLRDLYIYINVENGRYIIIVSVCVLLLNALQIIKRFTFFVISLKGIINHKVLFV